ncbi:hypothetical protein B2M26_05435 [Ferroacidibacillus organovorans]|uniref:Nudix hydrolase domain-containing protein n=2 Tax=Ferroacidibacillus organovorans TaxID=1765683 RepID=A0A1V4EUK7_9BACL|nr:hypothetical protein B2M26_05435 [Ferroacidibacillus organovorans]
MLSMNDIQAPRLAATVILVDAWNAQPFRVLLIKRPSQLRVLPGFWVFPGGRVEMEDGLGSVDETDALLHAAIRETREEVGILLEKQALLWFGRRVTPNVMKHRFDTHFFIARIPHGTEFCLSVEEAEEAQWCTPDEAFQNAENGTWLVAPPTRDALRTLSSLSADALFNGGVMQAQVENRDEIDQFVKSIQMPLA